MFCSLRTPDGAPFEGDPRHVLARTVEKAQEMGYVFNVGPELEFYYFKDAEGTEVLDRGGYFDLTSLDYASDLRRDTVLTLEKMGIPVEYSHHENGPSQHEIDLRFTDALSMADAVMTYKLVVKEIAMKHGVYASFMPKPMADAPGSGMHVHQSLFDLDGNNAFYDPDDPQGYHLSKVAKHYLAGLLKYAPEFCAVTNQYVNSYKRLIAGGEAPTYLSWARANRSTLVRIPGYRPDARARAASSCAAPTPREPLPGLRRHAGGGPQGHRGRAGAAGAHRGPGSVHAVAPGSAPAGHRHASREPGRGGGAVRGVRADARDAGRSHPFVPCGRETRRVERLPGVRVAVGARPLSGGAVMRGAKGRGHAAQAGDIRRRQPRQRAQVPAGALEPGRGRGGGIVRAVQEAARAHPDYDLVVYEARGDALSCVAQAEALLLEDGSASLLVIVGEDQLGASSSRAGEERLRGARNAGAGECAARIRQLLWPGNEGSTSDYLVVENMAINLATYQVTVNGEPLDLTYLEYALLAFLVTHPGRTYSRDALLRRVWGFDYYGGSRTVDVHVRRVRAKLGPDLAQHLETVRGVGYLWSA